MKNHGVMPGGCGRPPHRWIPKDKSARRTLPTTATPPTDGESSVVTLWKRLLIACRLSAPPSPVRRPPGGF
jgi:hypothetical protein